MPTGEEQAKSFIKQSITAYQTRGPSRGTVSRTDKPKQWNKAVDPQFFLFEGPAFAQSSSQEHNKEESLNAKEANMTSDELTARLEAIEARAEARAAERFARTDTQMARFEERLELSLSHLTQNQTRLEAGMRDLTSSIGQMKWWMIGTGLTVVLGIAAFNATVLSNMVSSFDSGRETANQNAAAAREVSNAIRELRTSQTTSKNPPQASPAEQSTQN